MTKEIEFLFDYGSPFSYLASTQMPELGKRNAATIVYVPIALGAVLKATGNASPMAVPAKGNYMGIELRRWAKRYGVPFRANPHPFMRNTMHLVRGAVAAQKLGVFDAYHDAVYRAVWAEAIDLGDDATLAGVLDKAAVPAAEVLAAIESRDVKDTLRRNTDDAVSRGVFGAPTFFVGSEMFWGNDRLEFVEEALRKIA